MINKFKKIKYLISQNRLEQAIKTSISLFDSDDDRDFHQSTIIISRKFRKLRLDANRGILDNIQINQEENKISNKLLNLLNDYKDSNFEVINIKEESTEIINVGASDNFFSFDNYLLQFVLGLPNPVIEKLQEFYNKKIEELHGFENEIEKRKLKLEFLNNEINKTKIQQKKQHNKINYEEKKGKELKNDLSEITNNIKKLSKDLFENKQELSKLKNDVAEEKLIKEREIQISLELKDKVFLLRKEIEQYEEEVKNLENENNKLNKLKKGLNNEVQKLESEKIILNETLEGELDKIKQQKLIFERNAEDLEKLKTEESEELESFFNQVRVKKIDYQKELSRLKEEFEKKSQKLNYDYDNKVENLELQKEELVQIQRKKKTIDSELSQLQKKIERQNKLHQKIKLDYDKKLDGISKLEYQLSIKKGELNKEISKINVYKNKIDNLEYEESEWLKSLKMKDTVYLKKYLDSFPNGMFQKTAMYILSRIENDTSGNSKENFSEESFWKDSIKTDSYLKYREYLDRFPNGKYVDQAKIELARKEREIQEKK